MIRLIYLNELVLIRPKSHAGVLFTTVITFLKQILDFALNFQIQVKLSNDCHDIMQKTVINFNDVLIVSVKENDYRIYFWYISKDEAINLLRNFDLSKKSGTL